MNKNKKTSVITVQNIPVTIASFDVDDYICITDMAKAKGGDSRAADIIKNWIRSRSTLEFLGTWEIMHNSNFKVVEFDHFKMQANYTKQTEWLAYADEADLLNVVLFGCTAKEWRETNPELAKKSNIRDFASVNELTVLSNLETHNAELAKEGKGKVERFKILLEIARYQIAVLDEAERMKLDKGRKVLGNREENEYYE